MKNVFSTKLPIQSAPNGYSTNKIESIINLYLSFWLTYYIKHLKNEYPKFKFNTDERKCNDSCKNIYKTR